MRIAIANTAHIWGGAEKIMLQLVAGLAARGHDVLLLISKGAPVSRELSAHCTAVTVPRGFDLNPFGVWKSMQTLRDWNADVLVIWTTKDTRIAGIGGRIAGVPVIVRRSVEVDMPRKLRHRLVNGWIAPRYLANANATRASLVRSVDGLREDDVDVIYNGIDIAAIDKIAPLDLDAELKLPVDALKVTFISRVQPEKGVAELMNAWPRVVSTVPTAHLIIAGTGSLDADVKAWSATTANVHVLGFRKDAIALLKSADILVLPSHKEGAPNIVMEAMACAKCIVATAVSGTPELVTDNESARLIPARNEEALGRALIEVLNDAALRARLGNGARERIRAFNFDRMVDEYVALFQRVVAARE